MDMGLVSMAVNFKNSMNIADVSPAVLAKALDTNRDYGQGLVEMLEQGFPCLLGCGLSCQLDDSLSHHGIGLILIIPAILHP